MNLLYDYCRKVEVIVKKGLIVICLLLAVFLTGCDKDSSKNKEDNVHSSYEALYDELCAVLSSKDIDVDKYSSLIFTEKAVDFRGDLTEEEYKEVITNVVFTTKECRHELTRTLTDEATQDREDDYNEEYKTKYDFKECKFVQLYAGDERVDNSVACQVDGNWYILSL